MIRILLLIVALGMVSSSRAAQPRIPVWIDTDPALGELDRDVDDGFAMVQAFNSPELDIRGVSVVFGNVPLDRGVPIARRLARDFGPAAIDVFAGAARADQLGRESGASKALAAALRVQPLTILALGPATNVATVIERHPELSRRIVRVIAVAGRRPGQRFTTGTTNVKGHRDFNFELDPAAFRVLLASTVPLVLTPFEISSKIWIERADLDRLARGGPAARRLEPPARRWLDLWQRLFGVSGFNPFDALAVGYVLSPQTFACEDLAAAIEVQPDDVTEPGMQGTKVDTKPFLLVSGSVAHPSRRVTYCSTAPSGFKRDLLDRLSR